MRYTVHNSARGASVFDVDSKEKIDHVMEVDTCSGELLCVSMPLRVNASGDGVETRTVKFRSIYPIYGGNIFPGLFHCYGRQQ